MGKQYQICTRCIMDISDPDIKFDDNGVCNHCQKYDEAAKTRNFSDKEKLSMVQKIIGEIKENGKGKDYDCLIGLSGGVDSSYVAYLAKKFGLRPLAVHFDNGWNSEFTVKNIEDIVKKLNIDLCTYVVDWEEFKDLQRSFFKASVRDIEMLTDHAQAAVAYQVAEKRNIKYILKGNNIVTEDIMPESWVHRKSDLKNIKAIQKLFGTKKIKSFPAASTFRRAVYEYIKGIKLVRLLDYVPYVKKEAIAILEKKVEWQSYKVKHGESIFTKFFQGYILPVKFNIDKRRAHCSSLICSGQMSREEALDTIAAEIYSEVELEENKQYVIKKLGFTEDEFEEIMKLPVKSHLDYSSDQNLYKIMRIIYEFLKKTGLINLD